MKYKYHTFMSYSSSDRDVAEKIVSRLRRDYKLDVWFDEDEIAPGDELPPRIKKGLEQSRTVTVLLGENSGGWQQKEINTAIARNSARGNSKVIPVLLPGVDRKRAAALFLESVRAEPLRSVDDTKALDRIVFGITGKPAGSTPAQPVTRAPRPAQDARAAAQKLTQYLSEARMVFVVGSPQADGNALARDLLRKIKLPVEGGVTPPLDVSAWYYEVKNGEDALMGEIEEATFYNRPGFPLTQWRLAWLLAERSGGPRGQPTVVVTTDVDLSMERALVLAGVSFTRIVPGCFSSQDEVNSPQLEVSRVVCRPHDGVVDVLPDCAESAGGRPLADATLDHPPGLRFVPPFDRDGPDQPEQFQRGLDDWDRWNDLDEAIVGQTVHQHPGPIGGSPRDLTLDGTWPKVLLFKLQGSIDALGGCVVTPVDRAEHIDLWRDHIPEMITTRLRQAAILLLGYCELEPGFLVVRKLLLRPPHHGDVRVLVRSPPELAPPNLDEREPVVSLLWSKLQNRSLVRNKCDAVAVDCAALLMALGESQKAEPQRARRQLRRGRTVSGQL